MSAEPAKPNATYRRIIYSIHKCGHPANTAAKLREININVKNNIHFVRFSGLLASARGSCVVPKKKKKQTNKFYSRLIFSQSLTDKYMLHYELETNSVIISKLLSLLHYFKAIRLFPASATTDSEIDENSADYKAFWAEMAQKEIDKNEKTKGRKALFDLINE